MGDPTAVVAETLAEAGVRGWVHARPVAHAVGSDDEVALDADEPVAMASVYKLPLLVAWCRAVDAGDLDPAEPVSHVPERRTPGPTGVSALADPVVMSRRDTVRQMVALSDNAAADAVLDWVGVDRVNAVVADLGLASTRLAGGTAHSHDVLARATGAADLGGALRALADSDRAFERTVYRALLVSSTTARDMTRLLADVWTDRAASPASCAFARSALRAQPWRHRLASGFPHDDVVVAGKTGTLAALRHEVGVVEFPGEVPVAVAVLTRAARPELALPRADAAVGAAARAAVTPLRRPLPGPDHPGPDHPGPDHPGPDHPGPDHPGPDHPGPDHPGDA